MLQSQGIQKQLRRKNYGQRDMLNPTESSKPSIPKGKDVPKAVAMGAWEKGKKTKDLSQEEFGIPNAY